jgi:uncharacterized protein CbrC (UPF0167 family)
VEELPSFRYHPDPIGTGSIAESGEACRCCHQARGYMYTGPVYAEEELDAEVARFTAIFEEAQQKGLGPPWLLSATGASS